MSSATGLDEASQRELASFLEAEQAKARVQSSIHNFTQMCWDKCITGGVSTRFGRGEEACLSNCVERFLDTSLFMVQRLQETQKQMGNM